MGVDAEPGIANPLWPFERLKRPKLRETDGVSRSGTALLQAKTVYWL